MLYEDLPVGDALILQPDGDGGGDVLLPHAEVGRKFDVLGLNPPRALLFKSAAERGTLVDAFKNSTRHGVSRQDNYH